MGATNIIDSIVLDGEWQQVDNEGYNNFYVIGVKEDAQVTDTIDVKKVRLISLELGIDSGIENKPITIGRVTLNFGEETSSDPEINSRTAFTFLSRVPDVFYIRPISIDDGSKRYTDGSVSIGINVNAFKI